ncbi:MAG TPA: hypothetical protein VL866_20205 [Pyrinomonadaceae bacterium]|nr:hypothetical protein [Pyrinomonadaceae bacterium]
MFKRTTLKFSILSAAFLALCLPAIAAAQWGRYPDNRYPDNRYPDNGRYDDRYARDSAQRLDRLAKDFERDMDRALDHSRVNGSRREDAINDLVHDFRRAAGDFKSRVGNGRDLDRSYNEARRVVQLGDAVERQARPRWFDSRLSSEWSQIRRELQTIENIYGIRGNRGRVDDIYRDRRNDDIYRDRRNDDINRDRNRSNNDWLRRLPFPLPY